MSIPAPDLAALRLSYKKATLDVNDTVEDPIEQFQRWFAEALKAQLTEPNAMTLATVDATGQVSARTVLLKGVDHEGFRFFTNYESRKAKAMSSNPRVALSFFWSTLERQIQIDGSVQKLSRQESESYFRSRPYPHQIGAWTSAQSTPIESREALENREREVMARFPEGTDVPLPEFWGGFLVRPTRIEFWQGRESRLHDRIVYTQDADGWKRGRLCP